MTWILEVAVWWLFLFLLGLAFLPLAKRLFGRFFDSGYPFAKTLGILFLSYSAFILGLVKILPFYQVSLIGLAAVAAFINYGFIARKGEMKEFFSQPIGKLAPIIFEEALFIAGLLFLAYVRGQEPSIRGLEKFMDFGFISSILKSKFFPPLDMWYSADPTHPAGYPINYYYFGHLTGAVLIKLTGMSPFIGYNLILATIFAQAITLAFSLCGNIVHFAQKAAGRLAENNFLTYFIGIIGSYIINLGGNLHTVYLFTKGYPNDSPIPFWKILSGFDPTHYWYPNATRFIPFTIHEFPSYSYVVADLHGHVFDIPFVLLTLSLVFALFISFRTADPPLSKKEQKKQRPEPNFIRNNMFIISIVLGLFAAVHYMTNAWDLAIYGALIAVIYFLLFKWTRNFFTLLAVLGGSAIAFIVPFSLHFKSIVSSIGVNCAPAKLVAMQKLGPFLFEKGNCQVSPPWMLFVLWGFFLVNFALLFTIILRRDEKKLATDLFALVLFSIGTLLIIFPEFFYLKDIYPQHFRANTMFKFGYQAFIMMGTASAYTFYRMSFLKGYVRYIYKGIFLILFAFVFIYPFFSFPSYYGKLDKPVNLDGSTWLRDTYPEDKEIIDYINKNFKNQSVILEAQGDSYTDYDVISSYTGHPTVAGWWVHEWLWRGSSDIVGSRIPSIVSMYESTDIPLTKKLLKDFRVKYVIITTQERLKYPNLNEYKFGQIGKKIFVSLNGKGIIYEVN